MPAPGYYAASADEITLSSRRNGVRLPVRFVPPTVNSATRKVSRMVEQMAPVLPSLGVLFEF